MELQDFIEKFKSQLEDVDTLILPETNYVQSEFWDSLTAMVIKVMIEDEYAVDIDVEDLQAYKTVESLFNSIITKK